MDDQSKRTRALPSVYHGSAQIYAHKDVDNVLRRLATIVGKVLASTWQPAYLVTACRVDGVDGLYARDIFNRSSFRLAMARNGLELSDDSYVRMTSDGLFEAEGWPAFRPRFIVTKDPGESSDTVFIPRNKGAFLTFLFGILRVGDMGESELRHLVRTIKEAEVVVATTPAETVQTLREL